MAIQWYPGHMNKAKKAIVERLKNIDVVIEMLDARLPGSSANPLLENLSQHKHKLKILNKQDLADPERTVLWLDFYNKQANTKAIALDASERAPAQKLIAACRALSPTRTGVERPLRVLICGIPNVGKSTLINTLLGKKSAKTGNEPGITKAEQRLFLADDFWLYDTPGMLWPKIIVVQGGYNLAASGAVGRNALDEEEVALEWLNYVRHDYADKLIERFKLDASLDTVRDWQDTRWLDEIARKRGAILSGGRIDVQKVAEIVLTDFRSGAAGQMTLETPEQWLIWLKQAKENEIRLREVRAKRKLERQGS